MRAALFLLSFVVMLALSACGQRTIPELPLPSAVEPSGPVTLQTVLTAPNTWSGRSFTLISPVLADAATQLLVRRAGSDQAPADGTDALWLAEPLPEDIRAALPEGSGILELQGRLSPPGAYGPEQRFPYQFNAERVALLKPERSTIANLALNPGALDKILLELDGVLLARPDEALLVDEASAGGVPSADASRLKLDPGDIDESVVAALAQSGDVRWGRVSVVGWWQNGALQPLMIEPVESGNPIGTAEPATTVQP